MFFLLSLDDTDNDVKQSPHYNSLIIPSHLCDSDDKNNGSDFFKSVESQIFPQGVFTRT